MSNSPSFQPHTTLRPKRPGPMWSAVTNSLAATKGGISGACTVPNTGPIARPALRHHGDGAAGRTIGAEQAELQPVGAAHPGALALCDVAVHQVARFAYR